MFGLLRTQRYRFRPFATAGAGRLTDRRLDPPQLGFELVDGREIGVALDYHRLWRCVGKNGTHQPPQLILHGFLVEIVPAAVGAGVAHDVKLNDAVGIDITEPGIRIEAMVPAVDKQVGYVEQKAAAAFLG